MKVAVVFLSRDREGVPMAVPAAKCDQDAISAPNGITDLQRVFNGAGAWGGADRRVCAGPPASALPHDFQESVHGPAGHPWA